ncbi:MULTISPECIES: DUF4142 domain-containing protein [Sinorhizobium]|uniref:DUF4142 domain-containing protein n=1 Tax=Sinorhizobium americanum TaxID=194963 RepID=A0A2S3YJ22_9HYPH|nr:MULTISPECIES: DUF4142 domain-containing protein [Sinorhizobium]PDT41151.1 hypothetical protein CO656_14155 [Sinorhizobium sp. FG01]PDT51756.1 hypothetical protein CO664_18035 [Sinorhizobium sp. NG07B]POH26978.1 hypothetical protein ATY31_23910 [Sinorhizobium americanum]POH27078.1 hypothetical protein ATY30_22555 [Sinorhizobium americanum]
MRRRHVLCLAAAGALPIWPPLESAVAQEMAADDAERKHARSAMRVGALSLAASRTAENTTSDALLKQFAKWEIAEQEAASNVLRSMEPYGGTSDGSGPPADAQLETMLDAEGRTALEKLRSLQGPAFDKAYVLLQSDGHKKLLAIHEEYVRSGRDRERRNVARLTRLLIEEHLEHLEMLRIRLG